MSKSEELRYGAPGENAVHICVDMQRMFAESTEWKMPWLPRVLPNIIAIASAHPERIILTRFIPAAKPGHGVGMWRHYYERWGSMTIDQLGPEMIGLVPELAEFVPQPEFLTSMFTRRGPGPTCTSSYAGRELTPSSSPGDETDVCVLATMLGAIDRGFRTILVTDALCSSCRRNP